MDLIDAVVLGIVEGITEYLPVSSTGHLILTAWMLGLDRTPEARAAVNAYNVIIQGGAILAVIGLYRARVASMIRGLLGKDPRGRRLFVLLLTSFLPAMVLGALLDNTLEALLFKPVPVIVALFTGGVVLLLIRRWQAALYADAQDATHGRFKSIDDLTLVDALVIGLMQCVAMWPGTSRSMMTILGGMVRGLRPAEAAEFSFLVGLPTLLGACAFKLFKQVRLHGLDFVEPLGGWLPVLVGIAVATISAALAVRWLVGYLSRHSLAVFGWWRIAVAIVIALLIYSGSMTIEPKPSAAPTAGGSAAPTPPAR